MTYFYLATNRNYYYKHSLFMKKIIQTLVIATFTTAGASQFLGCGEAAAPEDPPEAAEQEEEEAQSGVDEGE